MSKEIYIPQTRIFKDEFLDTDICMGINHRFKNFLDDRELREYAKIPTAFIDRVKSSESIKEDFMNLKKGTNICEMFRKYTAPYEVELVDALHFIIEYHDLIPKESCTGDRLWLFKRMAKVYIETFPYFEYSVDHEWTVEELISASECAGEWDDNSTLKSFFQVSCILYACSDYSKRMDLDIMYENFNNYCELHNIQKIKFKSKPAFCFVNIDHSRVMFVRSKMKNGMYETPLVFKYL